eukprot:gene30914-38206_t
MLTAEVRTSLLVVVELYKLVVLDEKAEEVADVEVEVVDVVEDSV